MLDDSQARDAVSKRPDRMCKIVNAADANVELDELCLSCMVDSESAEECVRFFEVYSLRFRVPVSVAVKLQDMTLTLLSLGAAPDVVDSALTVVAQISGSYSATYRFAPLVEKVWQYLPRASAFNALSSLLSANEPVLQLLLERGRLDALRELLTCGSIATKSGVLGVFHSLSMYGEHASLESALSFIIDFHFFANGPLRVQSFELLASLLCSGRWCANIGDRLHELFCVEDNDLSQLVASLRLLRVVLEGCAGNSLVFMEKSGGWSLCVAALNQESELCRKTGTETCIALLKNKCGADEVVNHGIAATVMNWIDVSFELLVRAFVLLCLVFCFGTSNTSQTLLQLGFVNYFVSSFSSALFHQDTSAVSLTTLLRIISVLRATGGADGIADNAEIHASLDSFSEQSEACDLHTLALIAKQELS